MTRNRRYHGTARRPYKARLEWFTGDASEPLVPDQEFDDVLIIRIMRMRARAIVQYQLNVLPVPAEAIMRGIFGHDITEKWMFLAKNCRRLVSGLTDYSGHDGPMSVPLYVSLDELGFSPTSEARLHGAHKCSAYYLVEAPYMFPGYPGQNGLVSLDAIRAFSEEAHANFVTAARLLVGLTYRLDLMGKIVRNLLQVVKVPPAVLRPALPTIASSLPANELRSRFMAALISGDPLDVRSWHKDYPEGSEKRKQVEAQLATLARLDRTLVPYTLLGDVLTSAGRVEAVPGCLWHGVAV